MLWFNLAGGLTVYALQRVQQWLPRNPQAMSAVGADSSFNTAASFITNTNWQGYAGEAHDELSARRCSRWPFRISRRPRPEWRCWSR